MQVNEGLSKKIMSPPVILDTRQFLVKLAENQEEVRKAQRLRYDVFNLEQGKGLDESGKNGLDVDEFDESCMHLIVVEKTTEKVIGTYRIFPGFLSTSTDDFYSSREYKIEGLDKIASSCMELGRSCVSPGFRTGTVVSHLWSAIADLLKRGDLRYMLGCASLETTDSVTGWALHRYFCQKKIVYEGITVVPREKFTLERPPEDLVGKALKNKEYLKKCIPPLFKGYLRIGAEICGEPAMDGEFGTIDFFVIVDITKVPERYLRYFNYIKQLH